MEQFALLVETEQRAKSNTHRIDKLEQDNAALHQLATSVAVMAENIEAMNGQLKEQGKRLEAIERQPAQNWETFRKTVLTSIVSTLAGGAVGALLAILVG